MPGKVPVAQKPINRKSRRVPSRLLDLYLIDASTPNFRSKKKNQARPSNIIIGTINSVIIGGSLRGLLTDLDTSELDRDDWLHLEMQRA